MMVNRSSKDKHFHFLPDLGETYLVFHLLCMILAPAIFIDGFYYGKFPSFTRLFSFDHE